MNQLQPQSVEINASAEPQILAFYLPTAEVAPNRSTLAFRRHPVLTLVCTGFVLYCLESLWSANGYWGREILWHWRAELLAGVLSLLKLVLWRTFRRWSRERVAREVRRKEYLLERELLLKQLVVPPKAPKRPATTIMIDYWASNLPQPLDGQESDQLPPEFLAPDALVLNFQLAAPVEADTRNNEAGHTDSNGHA